MKYLAAIINPVVPVLNAADPVAATNSILQTIISALIVITCIYFFIYFVLGGINFITSEGDKGQLEVAKKQLTYAFIGIFVTFSVFAVMRLLGTIFGIPGLQNLTIDVPTVN